MLDGISFTLAGGKAPELENLKMFRDDYYRGKLGTLTVKQYPDGVYCTGSIAKYLNGENVSTLNRHGVKDALSKLEAATGWDLKRAVVKTLEIGATLPVKNPPCNYLTSWGSLSRFTKSTYQKKYLETVTLYTGERSFTGYDKRAEAKEIPPIFSGSELIRLELKYKKALKKHLGKLTPWDLAEKEIYTKLVKRWQGFYFAIPKGRAAVLDISDGISPKDLDNVLRIHGLQALGYDKYLGFIATLESRGALGIVQAMRARKAARDLAGNIISSQADGLTQELDARVREQAALCR